MNEGIRLYRQKKYRDALNFFLEVSVDDDDQAILSYYLGLCYTHLGKHDEALLYLEQVVNSDIGFLHIYQARMIMGYIYAVSGRYRLAEFELNRLLEDGYESAKVYAALAYAVHAQGRTAPAISNLEKALRIDPDNTNALNSLGYILAENGAGVRSPYGPTTLRILTLLPWWSGVWVTCSRRRNSTKKRCACPTAVPISSTITRNCFAPPGCRYETRHEAPPPGWSRPYRAPAGFLHASYRRPGDRHGRSTSP